MKKHVVVKCTSCGKSTPIDDPAIWVTINVTELKEVECVHCGSTSFRIMEVPDG